MPTAWRLHRGQQQEAAAASASLVHLRCRHRGLQDSLTMGPAPGLAAQHLVIGGCIRLMPYHLDKQKTVQAATCDAQPLMTQSQLRTDLPLLA